MKRPFLVGVLSLLLASGCAAIPPSQVGQTVGTIAGSAVAPGIGAPVGALVGLLAGMVLQGEVDKGTEKRERKELSQQLGVGSNPSAALERPTQGEPIRIWVDETVREGRLIAGHFDVGYLP